MRLFVAVNFPDELRRGIWAASAPLREAGLPVRWVEETALHLTLKFLGEVAAERQPEIATALEQAAAGTRAFTLPVAGFGAFPSMERPRVIWVGCEGVPALELLQHRLEQGMERLGFPVEGRPFRPHLTLGRAKQNAGRGSFRGLQEALERLEYAAESTVRSLELMESTPGPDGSPPRYCPVHSVAFEESQPQ